MPPIARADSYAVTAGQPVYAGRMGTPPPGVDALLTTLTLQNTSAAVQAAGFVSPMFGVPLAKGQMPAGQYPQFKLGDGTSCPATIWGVSTWPDGSMKFCAAMVRVPASVAGSGSLPIQVYSGGTAPAASTRTTSDLTTADIKVELTGIANLSGVWTASLNTAITDAEDIVELASGPAGKVWRIGGPCKQSGAAHGQLHAWHYVAALTNSTGTLLGLRYLGRIGQPWVDVTTPTPTRRELSANLKSGATTIRDMQGHNLSETLGSTIGMPHYTSIFTAGTSGKWDFIQGGGSAASDCTVRITHDKTHVVKSRLVPPLDLSLTVSAGSSFDYYPQGRGPLYRNHGETGDRDELGVFTQWASRHIHTQSASDEQAVRVVGMVSSGWRALHRRSTTGQIIPCTDPSPSYAGLGTIQTSWRYRAGETSAGLVQPADETSLWASEYEPSHRASACYYPYMVTGEPQYLDMLVEQAAGLYLGAVQGNINLRTTLPITKTTITTDGSYGCRDATIASVTYKGGGYFATGGLLRIPAWGMRDVAQAGALYPDTCPFGTETRKYLRELSEGGFAAMNAYNAALPQSWRDSGLMNFDERPGAAGTWGNGFMSHSVCHQAEILDSTAGATLRAHLGRFWSSMAARMDIACGISYGGLIYDEAGVRITSMDDLTTEIGSTLTFSTSTNRATVSGVNGSWSPTNGDIFTFNLDNEANRPFAEAVNHKKFYAVNCVGNTMQLAETPGGVAITVTNAVATNQFFAQLQNFAPHFAGDANNSPTSYLGIVHAAICFHEASGDTFVSAARAEAAAKVAIAGFNFSANQKNGFSTSYPS